MVTSTLTPIQKFGIAGGVLLFAIAVVGLVFAVLSWLDHHTHERDPEVKSGLMGMHFTDAQSDLGYEMKMYDTETGRCISDNLLPNRTKTQNKNLIFQKGRVPNELVSVWETQNESYVSTHDVNAIHQDPTLLKITQASDASWAHAWNKRAPITWDATRNVWLMLHYQNDGAFNPYMLHMIDPVTGVDTAIGTAAGGAGIQSDESGANGAGAGFPSPSVESGPTGLCFCGTRLFASCEWIEDTINRSIGVLYELNPDTGMVIGQHQWNKSQVAKWATAAAAGQVITSSTEPLVANKNLLDGFLSIDYKPETETVYFLLGTSFRTLGWVPLAEIPDPLTNDTPFNLHVAIEPFQHHLDSICMVPGFQIQNENYHNYRNIQHYTKRS